MTNLVCTLTLISITNWTHHVFQEQELGYVVSNHVMTYQYRDFSNSISLYTNVSPIAVWRPVLYVTNAVWFTNTQAQR